MTALEMYCVAEDLMTVNISSTPALSQPIAADQSLLVNIQLVVSQSATETSHKQSAEDARILCKSSPGR